MRARAVRVLAATVSCLFWLNGCETSTRLGDLFQSNTVATQGLALQEGPPTTGSVRPAAHPPSSPAAKASPDKDDDVSLGKTNLRAGNCSLRQPQLLPDAEVHPRGLES